MQSFNNNLACKCSGVECTIEFLTEMGDLPIIQATYDTVTVVVSEETAGNLYLLIRSLSSPA